jgi:hypothetical protein
MRGYIKSHYLTSILKAGRALELYELAGKKLINQKMKFTELKRIEIQFPFHAIDPQHNCVHTNFLLLLFYNFF